MKIKVKHHIFQKDHYFQVIKKINYVITNFNYRYFNF